MVKRSRKSKVKGPAEGFSYEPTKARTVELKHACVETSPVETADISRTITLTNNTGHLVYASYQKGPGGRSVSLDLNANKSNVVNSADLAPGDQLSLTITGQLIF
jgi:hypothetical protein